MHSTRPSHISDAWSVSPASFHRLAEFIHRELGIRMPDSKMLMIQSRLGRRVRELGLRSIDEYCDLVFSTDGAAALERVELINAVTTNKTDFFREARHFDFLKDTVLPGLERQRRTSAVIWSAACSSGEEPYSLAMVLSDYSSTHPGFTFRILATDVSTKVLEAARDGIYTKQQVEPVPLDYRRKYLLYGKGDKASLIRIAPALRRAVSFHQLNFMDSQFGVREMFDVIFCRNVLIYFDRPTQEAVVNKLCRHLSPGGFLLIGLSESLSGMNVPLTSAGASCHRKVG